MVEVELDEVCFGESEFDSHKIPRVVSCLYSGCVTAVVTRNMVPVNTG